MFIVCLSLSVMAPAMAAEKDMDEIASTPCEAEVLAVISPKLEALRTKLRRQKAADSRSYYEVFKLYEKFYLSSTKFDVVKEAADAVRISSGSAIYFCKVNDGDMNTGVSYNQNLPPRPSANETIHGQALPAIDKFYAVMDDFIKTHYNRKVARRS